MLTLGAAKLNGEISAGQRAAVQEQFESNFSLNSREASQLINSAGYLLAALQVIDAQMNGLADRCRDRFTPVQAESLLELMVAVASAGGDLAPGQKEIIDGIRSRIVPPAKPRGTWA